MSDDEKRSNSSADNYVRFTPEQVDQLAVLFDAELTRAHHNEKAAIASRNCSPVAHTAFLIERQDRIFSDKDVGLEPEISRSITFNGVSYKANLHGTKEAFVREQLDINNEEYQHLMTMHNQGLYGNEFLAGITYPLKEAHLTARPVARTLNYFRDLKGEICFRASLGFEVHNTEFVPVEITEIPGRVELEYVLSPDGFKLKKGYPCFTNSLLPALLLSAKNTVDLTDELLQLAKIEDAVRESRRSKHSLLPLSSKQKKVLQELPANLIHNLDNSRYLKEQAKKLNFRAVEKEEKRALIADIPNKVKAAIDKINLACDSNPTKLSDDDIKSVRDEAQLLGEAIRTLDEARQRMQPEQEFAKILRSRCEEFQKIKSKVTKAGAKDIVASMTILLSIALVVLSPYALLGVAAGAGYLLLSKESKGRRELEDKMSSLHQEASQRLKPPKKQKH